MKATIVSVGESFELSCRVVHNETEDGDSASRRHYPMNIDIC